jgi:hypothetical protein
MRGSACGGAGRGIRDLHWRGNRRGNRSGRRRGHAVAAMVRGQPTPHAAWLLIPGIPLLVVGQIWMIACNLMRTPPHAGRFWSPTSSWPSSFNLRRLFFGSLGWCTPAVLFAVALGGWLLTMTAVPAVINGQPKGRSATCAYELSDHGNRTCVSKSAYQRAKPPNSDSRPASCSRSIACIAGQL